MLILRDLLNQSSNQFIQHIHLKAFCIEYLIEFNHIPFIEKYFSHYPELAQIRITEKEKNNLKNKYYLFKVFKPSKVIKLNESDEKASQKTVQLLESKNNLYFCVGGLYRNTNLVQKHRSYFKFLFKASLNYDYLNAKYLKKNSNNHILIGVHIRRTDYVYYEKGMYLFDDNVYQKYISQIIALVGNDYKIIVFTDDKSLDIKAYIERFGNVVLSNCSVSEDYYIMGQCDYLLSTNSTFTLVASYLGSCKLYRFMSPNEIINNTQLFEECEILYHTENEAKRAGIATDIFVKNGNKHIRPNY